MESVVVDDRDGGSTIKNDYVKIKLDDLLQGNITNAFKGLAFLSGGNDKVDITAGSSAGWTFLGIGAGGGTALTGDDFEQIGLAGRVQSGRAANELDEYVFMNGKGAVVSYYTDAEQVQFSVGNLGSVDLTN